MKNLFLAFLILLSIPSFSQGVLPRSTNASNTLKDYRDIIDYNLVVPRYKDTTEANLQIGLDSSGAIIKTRTPDAFWVRGLSPRRWVKSATQGDIDSLVTALGGTNVDLSTRVRYTDSTFKYITPTQGNNLFGSLTIQQTNTASIGVLQSNKVDKITGKGLSTNDYDNSEKANVASSLAHISRVDNPHSTTKAQVGLGNVPNIDATNPSNITQSSSYRFATDVEKLSWNAKINPSDSTLYSSKANTSKARDSVQANINITQNSLTSHIGNLSNPHSVTKTQVGLANVDNTSDINKPVSTAQQAALNLKEPSITGGTTGQYWRGDKTWQALTSSQWTTSGSNIAYTSAGGQAQLTTSDATTFHGLEFTASGTLDAYIKQKSNTAEFQISAGRSSGWGGFITTYIDQSEKERVTSTGHGFGNINPLAKIHITGTATTSSPIVSSLISGGHTVTLSGIDPTTYSTMYANSFNQMTLVGTNTNQTVSDAATMYISGAPVKSTNAALGNTYGLRIFAGTVGAATSSFGAEINAQTGATNNYAARFLGGNTGFKVNTPIANVHIGAGGSTNPPLVIDGATLMSTPINNSIENSGTHIYYTAGGVRYQMDQQDTGRSTSSSTTSGTLKKVTDSVQSNITAISVNVQSYGVLPSNTAAANDIAISAMISAVPIGTTLFWPSGTYLNTGITITKTLYFKGHSKYMSIIKNVGVGTTAITISSNVQRGSFKDIAINGNGTDQYATDATSGKGVVFNNNSSVWHFDNVWMREHGDYFFYGDNTGHINNIYISHCELENGKTSAFHFRQSDYNNQINAIVIKDCNISWFGNNGLELWGQSITVQDCAIQACKWRGIIMDGANGTGSSDANSIRIDKNYFEKCDSGFIYARSKVITTGSVSRYILSLSITNNYGTYAQITPGTIDTSNINLVEIAAPDFYSYENLQVSGLSYIGNGFQVSPGVTKSIFNGNNVLSYNSVVQLYADNISSLKYYINLGRATTIGRGMYSGNGSPENKVTAPQGSLYRKLDGTISTLYFKEKNVTDTTSWSKVFIGDTTTITDGVIPIGRTSTGDFAVSTLTADYGGKVTNSSGSITIGTDSTKFSTISIVQKKIDSLGSKVSYGSYTPTLTNTLNISSSVVLYTTYTKIGNITHVSITGSLDPTTSSGAIELTFTLPVACTNGLGTNIGLGNIAVNGGSSYAGGEVLLMTTTTAKLRYINNLLGSSNFHISMDYNF